VTLPEQVSELLSAYPWSRAERRILPSIENQVIAYLSDGEGNTFIRQLCERYVLPRLDFNHTRGSN
jgi:hypothetical protein